jgi:hypothetical protein
MVNGERKKTRQSKKVQRANLITFSATDDVKTLMNKQSKGEKSGIINQAIREFFARKGEAPQTALEDKIIAGGLTKEQILQKVKDYVLQQFHEKTDRLEEKKREAREKDNYALFNVYNNMLWDKKVGLYEGGQEKWFKEVTIKEVEAATGLSYQIVYNKVLPVIREAGFNIVKERLLK